MIKIKDFDYPLPEDRIAKFPVAERDSSKLLLYKDGNIAQDKFSGLPDHLPVGSLLVFNNTKVIHARLFFFKESGARIEIFCIEPHYPADYERSLGSTGQCEWSCIIGNAKKWKHGDISIEFDYQGVMQNISAQRLDDNIVRFVWSADLSFGQILELLGKIPIPPYLNRDSQICDNDRYQTTYSKIDGSVAAPTAGLHFTDATFEALKKHGINTDEVTLHVGAGTFLPVKTDDAALHKMHAEHFVVSCSTLKNIINNPMVICVGTTAVRTLESLTVLGYRCIINDDPLLDKTIGQWEAYDIPADLTKKQLLGALLKYMELSGAKTVSVATEIMITPTYRLRVVDALVTNFHQPKSTLLLLISAFVGDNWKGIYDYALKNDFRFLSYGDSSLLFKQ